MVCLVGLVGMVIFFLVVVLVGFVLGWVFDWILGEVEVGVFLGGLVFVIMC